MTTATISLTDFLLARIAEDEANARHAIALGADCVAYDDMGSPSALRDAHDYDPRRAIAECEAKRRIVGHCMSDVEPLTANDMDIALNHVLSLLAAPYATHPDYQEEWRP